MMVEFIGEDRCIYMDSAATTLMMKSAWMRQYEYLRGSCANAHTEITKAGRRTGELIRAARCTVRKFLGAGEDYAVLFGGSGATWGLNRAAVIARHARPDRPYVMLTEMEHHSNILPWARAFGHGNVIYVPVREDGTLDLDVYVELLEQYGPRIAAVSVTAASNVTGLINPIHGLAEWAHAAGALFIIDAAQMAAHAPIRVSGVVENSWIDAIAFSGHKAYSPGSPGVLVVRKSLLPDAPVGDVGGGSVEAVYLRSVKYHEDPEARESSGTPDIPGIISLAASLETLMGLGMGYVFEHEWGLTKQLLSLLSQIEGVTIYGALDKPRTPVVAFNVRGAHHTEVSAWLDDRGVETRSGCFCAQPYVRALLAHAHGTPPQRGDGAVRLSLGLYSKREHVFRAVQLIYEFAKSRLTR